MRNERPYGWIVKRKFQVCSPNSWQAEKVALGSSRFSHHETWTEWHKGRRAPNWVVGDLRGGWQGWAGIQEPTHIYEVPNTQGLILPQGCQLVAQDGCRTQTCAFWKCVGHTSHLVLHFTNREEIIFLGSLFPKDILQFPLAFTLSAYPVSIHL